MFVGTFALLGVLGFTLPASAFVPAGGSLDCVLFACTSIKFEQGPTKIQGNVCVQQNNPPAAPGLLKTGNNNQIAFPGFKAIAQKVDLASGSQEGNCFFDTTVGANPANVCQSTAAFQDPGSCLPPPVVPSCVNAAPPINCPTGGSISNLAAGCYGKVNIQDGCTVTLVPGGHYDFQSLFLGNSASFGATSGKATVNVLKGTVTEPHVSFQNVDLASPSSLGECIEIANSSTVTNSTFLAPNCTIHIHQSTLGVGVEFMANRLIVEPVQLTPPPPSGCGCIASVAKNGAQVDVTGDGLDTVSAFFFKTDCNLTTACPGAGCFTATPIGAVTPTAVSLSTAGVPAGTYHVTAVSPGSTSCSTGTVTLP